MEDPPLPVLHDPAEGLKAASMMAYAIEKPGSARVIQSGEGR